MGDGTQHVYVFPGSSDAAGDISTTGPVLAVNSNATTLVVCDLNNDNKQDIIVGGGTPVNFIKKNGGGTFAAATTLFSGAGINALACGDVNKDGNRDVVALSNTNNVLYFAKGLGNGSAQTPVIVPTVLAARTLTLADVTQDGVLDALIGFSNGSRGGAAISQGIAAAAGFVPPYRFYATHNDALAVATADFDGDGWPDLVSANGVSAYNIDVLMNNQTGAFGPAVSYPATGAIASLAASDINNDGLPDIVGAYQAVTFGVVIRINHGGGVFNSPVFYAGPVAYWGLGLADLNADGLVDIVSANRNGNNVHVFLAQSPGVISSSHTSYTVGTNPAEMALSDMNNDGFVDIVTANFGSNNVSVALGDGTGAFGTATTTTSPGPAGTGGVAVADFNLDGFSDVATSNDFGSNEVALFAGSSTGVLTFSSSRSLTGGGNAYDSFAADLNGDGLPDIAQPLNSSGGVVVMYGTGSVSAVPSARFYPSGNGPYEIAFADFNRDGHMDMANVVMNDGGIAVHLFAGCP